MNLYRLCENSPLNASDPSGEDATFLGTGWNPNSSGQTLGDMATSTKDGINKVCGDYGLAGLVVAATLDTIEDLGVGGLANVCELGTRTERFWEKPGWKTAGGMVQDTITFASIVGLGGEGIGGGPGDMPPIEDPVPGGEPCPGGLRCFPAGTPVQVVDGNWRTADQIQSGDSVFASANGVIQNGSQSVYDDVPYLPQPTKVIAAYTVGDKKYVICQVEGTGKRVTNELSLDTRIYRLNSNSGLDLKRKAIDQVKVGDFVASRNAGSGHNEYCAVTRTLHSVAHRLVTATLTDIATGAIKESVTATPTHRFFVAGTGPICLSDIGIGSQIQTRAGPNEKLASTKESSYTSGVDVYNLEVGSDHSYFIGISSGLWVHNDCGAGSPDVPKTGGGVYGLYSKESGALLKVGRSKWLYVRRAAQQIAYPDFEFRVIAQSDDYAVQRGLEEYYMNLYQPVLNKIGGISPLNPNFATYMAAGQRYLANP